MRTFLSASLVSSYLHTLFMSVHIVRKYMYIVNCLGIALARGPPWRHAFSREIVTFVAACLQRHEMHSY